MKYQPIYLNKDFQHSVLKPLVNDLDAPLFFYDLDFLRTHLQSGVQICKELGVRYLYACKANGLGQIISCIRQSGADFDVASQGELEQVLEAEVQPDQIICTGPAKSARYLSLLLERGVRTFILESEQQLRDLQNLCQQFDIHAKALLRLQLQWDKAENSVLGGSSTTVFGLEDTHWIDVLRRQTHNRVDIMGVHCFQWGNLTNLDDLHETWHSVIQRSAKFCQEARIQNRVIDLGGGLGIDYKSTNLSEYSWESIGDILKKINDQKLFDQIWIEPGRYSVGLCAAYLSRVIDRKRTRNKDFLILESGMNHLLRPALTQEGFPVTNASSQDTQANQFSIHGPLCTSLDWLGTADLPANTAAEDILMFSKSGAYGFSESMPLFLAHQWPAEVCWSNEKIDIQRSAAPAQEFMK